ncbi:MAG: hypothetical protein FWG84_03595 [Bacteroidales bacterium]|nr:hypothetical protein [Bacteroidales bacterium]
MTHIKTYKRTESVMLNLIQHLLPTGGLRVKPAMTFIITMLLLLPVAVAQKNQQIGQVVYDESLFYAEVKQVNQFFRRFNNEENAMGVRYADKAPEFRNNELRKPFLVSLFDRQGFSIPTETRDAFLKEVTNDKKPLYLDFFGDRWYAELTTTFLWNGEQRTILLYLKIESEHQGYKWVISNVEVPEFDKLYREVNEEERIGIFLHPMSHEIDFMNVSNAFQDVDKIGCYIGTNFKPNHLSLFIDAMRKQNISFVSVNHVKFHFLQLDGWWFEINYLNRSDVNSGWLITNMLKISNKDYISLKRAFDYE